MKIGGALSLRDTLATPRDGIRAAFVGNTDVHRAAHAATTHQPLLQRMTMSELFPDIQGHESVKRGLEHAYLQGHLHHALLFSGLAGIGKALIARAFVQAIMCEQTDENHLVCCGTCQNCRRIDNANHPDFIEIDDPAATIKIDTIRELQRRLCYPPFESARRFVLIQDIHKMQDAAANCLLKTLEEPEEHTTFLLITSQIQKLLPTIVSRCQVIRFAPFSMDEVAEFLTHHDIPEAMALQLAALSHGSLGNALELSRGDYKTELIETFEDILSPNSTLDAFAIAATLKGKKAMAEHLISLLSMFVRDMAVLKADPNHPIILRHYREQILKRAEKTTEKNLHRALGVIQDVTESFQGNANELLAWERLMLGMHDVLF